MITANQIQAAIDGIETGFLEQCKRLHSKLDPNGKYYTCGQHLKTKSEQRGLHGVAAAINVLSKSELQDADIVKKGLFEYIIDPIEAEHSLTNADHNQARESDLSISQINTIKISELIIALSYMPRIAGVDKAISNFKEQLIGVKKDDKGWGFFLDKDSEYHCLPTAYAVLALCKIGKNDIAKEFLRSLYQNITNTDDANIDDSIRIFVLYVLAIANRDIATSGLKLKDLKKIFKDVWRRSESQLEIDIEQNIEYEGGPRHHYVRIPWQLYLVMTSLILFPSFLGKVKIQNLIGRIIEAVDTKGGVIYPHSGEKLSSRTNSTVYSALKKIKACLQRNHLFYVPFHYYDQVRTFLSSIVFINIVRVLILVLIALLFLDLFWHDELKNLFLPIGKLKNSNLDLMLSLLSFVLTFQNRR